MLHVQQHHVLIVRHLLPVARTLLPAYGTCARATQLRLSPHAPQANAAFLAPRGPFPWLLIVAGRAPRDKSLKMVHNAIRAQQIIFLSPAAPHALLAL